MRFVQKITFDLESLEYFRDELEWNVDTIEDVVKIIKEWNDEELYTLLGCPTDYECWAEETKA